MSGAGGAKATQHPRRVLATAPLIMIVIGSLYAWSIFLDPLQQALGASKASVSSVFAIATICFAVGMVFAPLLLGRVRPSHIALCACLLAAAGLAMAHLGESLFAVQLGYGVLFGIANALGYSLALQIANDALPHRRGLATGIVVASYALGAVIFTPLFRWGVEMRGPWDTFAAMAILMACLGLLFGWALRPIGMGARQPALLSYAGASILRDRLFWLLWVGFLFGASAGLMALGHAASMVGAYGGPAPAIALGTALIAACNGLGRLASGWLSDHFAVGRILTAAAVIGAAGLFSLALWPGVLTVFLCLALTGLAYGLHAAGYAAAVAYLYGPERVSAVFGWIFTAWGTAGLSAPIIAGATVDWTGDYRIAVTLAGVCACCSAFCSLALPKPQR